MVAAPNFAADIRPLFRDKDVVAMKPRGIDLSSYQDVKARALDIYAAVSAKAMPCDGPWNEEKVQKFKEWIDEGTQPLTLRGRSIGTPAFQTTAPKNLSWCPMHGRCLIPRPIGL